MDLLTHLLRSTRTRSPLIADLRLGGDVSLGIPHMDGIPFHYVVDGDCRLTFEGRCVELSEGDFVMLPRWPDYRVETGTGEDKADVLDFAARRGLAADYLQSGVDRPLLDMVGRGQTVARVLSGIITLAGQGDDPLTRDLPDVTLLHNAGAQLEPWLVAAIDCIGAEGSAPEPGFGAVADRLIELIFVSMLRRWLLQSDHEKGWMRGLTDPAISRALNALHAEPARHWKLGDLAAASGRSRSGFAAHFRAVMDETPFAYLARWRMHLAATLLRQSRRSVPDIAVSLGYNKPHVFARAFLSAFGETPTRYRRSGHAGRADDTNLHPQGDDQAGLAPTSGAGPSFATSDAPPRTCSSRT